MSAKALNLSHVDFETLSQLFSFAPFPVVITNADDVICYVNTSVSTVSGFSKSDLVDTDIATLLHFDKQKDHKIDDNKDQNHQLMNGYMVDKNSQHAIPVNVICSSIKIDDQLLTVCYVRDLTDKNQVQASVIDNNYLLEHQVHQRTKELEGTLKQLAESDRNYSILYENSPNMYTSIWIENRQLRQCNETLVKTLGYHSKADLLGRDVYEFIAPESLDEAKNRMRQLKEKGSIKNAELTMLHRSGKRIPILLNSKLIYDDQEGASYTSTTMVDQTDRKALQAEKQKRFTSEKLFRDNQNTYQAIFDATTDGWWDWQLGTHEIKFSPKFKSFLGYDSESFHSSLKGWFSIVYRPDLPKLKEAIRDHLQHNKRFSVVIRYVCKDGSVKWILCRGMAIVDADNQKRRMVGSHIDITAEKQNEIKLNRMARFDPLTNLPNRAYFEEALQRVINKTDRANEVFAVLFIDIDDFKTVNDTFGHQKGDEILEFAAGVIKSVVRTADFVARYGGDEFVVIMEQVDQSEEAGKLAQRVIDQYRYQTSSWSGELNTTLSIGIALYPIVSKDPCSLVRCADAAMYKAKRAGRNCYYYYQDPVNQHSDNQKALEYRLHSALENNEFSLVYQPLISLHSGRIYAFEVLLRWDCPGFGAVMPEVFIPLAERFGLINSIGDWVLKTACSQLDQWKHQHPDIFKVNGILLSINVSVYQLTGNHFVESLASTLSDYNISPDELIFEIAESALMKNLKSVTDALKMINDLGIGIAIDDFGTGYSSLSYLKDLSLSALKMDKSFMIDATNNQHNMAMIKAIIQFGAALGFEVVAEGIEEQKHFQLLKQFECDYGQGYYFSYPVKPEEVVHYIRQYNSSSKK